MNLRGLQIKVVILIFCVVLIVGFGLRYLHQTTQILLPLTQELKNLPGVVDASVSQSSLINRSHLKIKLELAEDLPLSVSLGQVYRMLENHGGFHYVELQEQSTPDLLLNYEKAQIIIEEAIMTGEFSLLEKRIETLGHNQGLNWELGVDREFVYLRLYNKEAMLQRAIPRTSEGNKIIIAYGGRENE